MSPIYQWECEQCGHGLERYVYDLDGKVPEFRRCVALLRVGENGDVEICPGDMRMVDHEREDEDANS